MTDDEGDIRAEEQNHDIEDDVQDWKQLSKNLGKPGTTTNSAIPKRGEKEFAPDGTSVQNQALQDSRESMYEVLDGLRGHNAKQKLVAVWIPARNMALVVHAKGNYFRDVGTPINIGTKVRGGMSLNALETVYLVERGSMMAYLDDVSFQDWLHDNEDPAHLFDYSQLVPLDLAFLYSLAFQNSGYSIDQYQVYSYLKRHGYLIQEFMQLNPESQIERYQNHILTKLPTITPYTVISTLFKLGSKLWEKFTQTRLFGRPISHSLHFATTHYFSYLSVYRAIRHIRAAPVFETLHTSRARNEASDEYKISFNVWKPKPTFSKKNPPMPDFQICVVNTDRLKFPTLATIQKLLDTINYTFEFESKPAPAPAHEKKKTFKKSTMPPTKKELKLKRQLERQSKLDQSIQLQNKYNKLRDNMYKYGSTGRNVVIATISNGILNFVNLTEGDFSLNDNRELDAIYPGKPHGIVCENK